VAYSKMDESSAEVVWLEILSYGLMFFIVWDLQPRQTFTLFLSSPSLFSLHIWSPSW
jgi:hypothetical protein